jgi:hypothetical protein
MPDWELNKPVAFLVFNRPDTTARVFEAIRQARPPKLLVVSDGPRADKPGEAERCAAVRRIIDGVDWPCEVLKNYSDTNLGCKRRVSSGLDWVFKTVEEAIVLEDDCLPQPTFFQFCQELLDRYRDDERVMMISGFNVFGVLREEPHDYFFSKYPHIWGWASWRRTWKLYDVAMKEWGRMRDPANYLELFDSPREAIFFKRAFDRVYNGLLDTWDAQVAFMFFFRKGLAAFPKANLISNIGFNPDATHTRKANRLSIVSTGGMSFPLRHPAFISRDVEKDNKRRKLEYPTTAVFLDVIAHLVKSVNPIRVLKGTQ